MSQLLAGRVISRLYTDWNDPLEGVEHVLEGICVQCRLHLLVHSTSFFFLLLLPHYIVPSNVV